MQFICIIICSKYLELYRDQSNKSDTSGAISDPAVQEQDRVLKDLTNNVVHVCVTANHSTN
jgi:hypothetical protein